MLSDKTHPCEGCGGPIRADFALCAACAGVACEADADDDAGKGQQDGSLSKNFRRRYAKAKSVFEVGIWSANSCENLFGVMIGSMTDVRNRYKELVLDNRRLRFELDKLGLVYDDCFSGELSPESHEFTKRDGSIGFTAGKLWHGHGFFKMAETIKARDLHSVLSPVWGNIHGSEVVDVKIIYSEKKAIKYTVKDAMKMYLSAEHLNKRLFKSSNWLPAGYREVDKVLTKWALYHLYDWDIEQGEPEQGYAPRLEYIPEVWLVKRDYLRRWCHGESLDLDLGDYKAYIIGGSISKYAVKRSADVL